MDLGSANNSKWASRSAAQLTRNLHQRFKPKSQPNVAFRKRQVDEFGIITITKYKDDQEIRSKEREEDLARGHEVEARRSHESGTRSGWIIHAVTFRLHRGSDKLAITLLLLCFLV